MFSMHNNDESRLVVSKMQEQIINDKLKEVLHIFFSCVYYDLL